MKIKVDVKEMKEAVKKVTGFVETTFTLMFSGSPAAEAGRYKGSVTACNGKAQGDAIFSYTVEGGAVTPLIAIVGKELSRVLETLSTFDDGEFCFTPAGASLLVACGKASVKMPIVADALQIQREDFTKCPELLQVGIEGKSFMSAVRQATVSFAIDGDVVIAGNILAGNVAIYPMFLPDGRSCLKFVACTESHGAGAGCVVEVAGGFEKMFRKWSDEKKHIVVRASALRALASRGDNLNLYITSKQIVARGDDAMYIFMCQTGEFSPFLLQLFDKDGSSFLWKVTISANELKAAIAVTKLLVNGDDKDLLCLSAEGETVTIARRDGSNAVVASTARAEGDAFKVLLNGDYLDKILSNLIGDEFTIYVETAGPAPIFVKGSDTLALAMIIPCK